MPTIRPYLSRENAYTSGIQSRATPSAFGSDIGAGLEGLGSAAAGMAPILKQKANEATAAQAATAVSTFDYTKPMTEIRKANELNPTGVADATKEQYSGWVIGHLKPLNLPPAAYQRAYRQLMSQQESVVVQQRNWEIQQTDARGQQLANEGINSIQNQIFSNPDAYDDLIPKMDQQIDVYGGVDAVQRENMKITGHQQLAFNRFKTKISDADTVEGLDAIQKELNSDPWTKRVNAKDTDQLTGIIESQKNTIQTLADSEALAGVEGIKERVEKGVAVPPEELQIVHARAVKANNPSISNKLAVLDHKIQITNTRGTLPTPAIQQELNERQQRAQAPAVGIMPIDNSAQKTYTGLRSRFVAAGAPGDGSIQAAVMAGNIKQESEFRSWAANKEEGAYGQMQWRFGRFTNLKEFATSKGKDWQDPAVQWDWIVEEGTTGKGLTPGQKAGFDQFIHATTLEEANAGLHKFIAYGDESEGTRLANARRIMSGYDQDASGKVMAEDPNSPAGMTQIEFAEQEALQALVTRNTQMIQQGNLIELWSIQSGQPPADIGTAEGLQVRLQQTQAAANYNGVPIQDATPFMPAEVTRIVQEIKNDQTGESTLQKMAALGSSEVGKAGAKQIGVTDPGFEYLSRLYAGGNNGRDIAASALAGRKFREADKGKTLIAGSVGGLSRSNDQDVALEQEFVSNVGKSLDLRSDRNTIRDEAFNLFVDRFFPHGLGTTEPGKQKWNAVAQAAYAKALQDVMGYQGGTPVLGKVNSEKTIMPDGITGRAFDTMLDELTPVDYMLASADGLPPKDIHMAIVSTDEIAGHGKFKMIMDDPEHGLMYQVQLADGNFLISAPGKPYIFMFEKVREKAEKIMAMPLPTFTPGGPIQTETPGAVSGALTEPTMTTGGLLMPVPPPEPTEPVSP